MTDIETNALRCAELLAIGAASLVEAGTMYASDYAKDPKAAIKAYHKAAPEMTDLGWRNLRLAGERRLTASQLFAAMLTAPETTARKPGRPAKPAPGTQLNDPTADDLAAAAGVSQATVKRLRTVAKHGDAETKAALAAGQVGAREAYEKTRAAMQPPTVEVVTPPATAAAISDDDRIYAAAVMSLSSQDRVAYINGTQARPPRWTEDMAGLRRFVASREQATAGVPAQPLMPPATDWRSLLTQGLAAYRASNPTTADAVWLTGWAEQAFDAAESTAQREGN